MQNRERLEVKYGPATIADFIAAIASMNATEKVAHASEVFGIEYMDALRLLS